jgi:hypothetical protein
MPGARESPMPPVSVSVVIAPISTHYLTRARPSFGEAPEIDDIPRALDTVLQPVEGVEAAGENPCVIAVAIEQVQCVSQIGRLKELEGRHDVSDYSHRSILAEFAIFNLQFENRLPHVHMGQCSNQSANRKSQIENTPS